MFFSCLIAGTWLALGKAVKPFHAQNKSLCNGDMLSRLIQKRLLANDWLVSLQERAIDFIRLVSIEETRKGHVVAIWILHLLGWIIQSWCGTTRWETWALTSALGSFQNNSGSQSELSSKLGACHRLSGG